MIGGAFIGGSFLSGSTISPDEVVYDTVTLQGGSHGGIFDKARGLNVELTDLEVDDLEPTDEYVWDTNIVYYAEFNDDTSAGNVAGVTGALTGWGLFRKLSTATKYTKLADLDPTIKFYYDYTVRANETYDYRIYAKSATQISDPLDVDDVLADFCITSFIDTVTDEVVLFNFNVNTGSIKRETNIYYYNETFGKHSSASVGNKDTVAGTFNATLGLISSSTGELYYPKGYVDEVVAFLKNNNSKYFKTKNGDIWEVMISGVVTDYMDESYLRDATQDKHFCYISFNYRQIADVGD